MSNTPIIYHESAFVRQQLLLPDALYPLWHRVTVRANY